MKSGFIPFNIQQLICYTDLWPDPLSGPLIIIRKNRLLQDLIDTAGLQFQVETVVFQLGKEKQLFQHFFQAVDPLLDDSHVMFLLFPVVALFQKLEVSVQRSQGSPDIMGKIGVSIGDHLFFFQILFPLFFPVHEKLVQNFHQFL